MPHTSSEFPLPALVTKRRMILGIPVGRPGRPPVLMPLTQKVTLVVTEDEKTRALVELDRSPCQTLAELIRQRADGSIDIVAWKEAAVNSLLRLDQNTRDCISIGKEISLLRKEFDRALFHDDKTTMKIVKDYLSKLENRYNTLKGKTDKRSARVITRLSFEARENLVWRAEKVGLSLSDLMRMQFFGYLPGSADGHMGIDSKRFFYRSVLVVAKDGWGTHPSTELCSHCREPLPTPHPH